MTSKGKPVLVATDLSARSDRAIDRATMIAQQRGVRLLVLHALVPGSRLESRLVEAEAAIRATLPDPRADVDVIPAMGSAPDMIVKASASADCELIVTGVARFNHVGDYFVGTAVDHVVRNAIAPVLVVKQRPHEPYGSILIATDYSSCSRAALLTAAALFPEAAIHLVHAYRVPYESWLPSDGVKEEMAAEAQKQLDAFVQASDIPDVVRARINCHLGYGELPSVIADTANQINADLVVVGTHGRSGFLKAMIGSMAENLLRSVSADTLMVREVK